VFVLRLLQSQNIYKRDKKLNIKEVNTLTNHYSRQYIVKSSTVMGINDWNIISHLADKSSLTSSPYLYNINTLW